MDVQKTRRFMIMVCHHLQNPRLIHTVGFGSSPVGVIVGLSRHGHVTTLPTIVAEPVSSMAFGHRSDFVPFVVSTAIPGGSYMRLYHQSTAESVVWRAMHPMDCIEHRLPSWMND